MSFTPLLEDELLLGRRQDPDAPAALFAPPVAAAGRASSGTAPAAWVRRYALLSFVHDLAELVKLRVTLLVLLVTAAGFILGSRVAGLVPDLALLAATLVGTALVAGGAAALNQVLERDRDGKMVRTRGRPLPAGRMPVALAAAVGAFLALAGVIELQLFLNTMTAALAGATLLAYVFAYTPLKSRTHLSTLVGALPGAMPPLMGWAAATGGLTAPAWTLFGIIFFWQLPHFLAIAWLYRADYARAGYPLLVVVDPSGGAAARQVLVQSLALLPVSLLPALTGLSGPFYSVSAVLLGSLFLTLAVRLSFRRTRAAARSVVLGSLLYLSLLFLALLADSPPYVS